MTCSSKVHSACFFSFVLGNNGRSSLTNEKDHHYFLNRFVCVDEFFDGLGIIRLKTKTASL